MADVTLADALTETRDRILTLARYAVPTASGAYAYADNKGTLDQYFELTLGGYDVTYPTQDTQHWVWKAELRFKLGQFTQDFQGQVQETAWAYIASAGQVFVQWRGLNDPTTPASPRVPYLDPANTSIHNARMQLVTEEVGPVWYLIFPWTLVFDTRFIRCGQ